MHTWDPAHYLTFADERGRPFVELVARIGAPRPGTVVDLGCGPGNLTARLAERWPHARVVGVDASPEMVAAARAAAPGIEVVARDLRDWLATTEPVDVLVSNATLQWVPGHLALVPALVAALTPGGWLGIQVPGNFDQPSHAIRRTSPARHRTPRTRPASPCRRATTRSSTWRRCGRPGASPTSGRPPTSTSSPARTRSSDWVSGTGARPTLQALPEELRAPFETELKRRLRAAYPARDGRVVLPFRRVFAVAQRPADAAA
ncbi:MAG: methyltransferase domain-containing protein [Nocardioides sp.]